MRTFIFLCCATVFALTPTNLVSQHSKIKIAADESLTVDEVFDLIMEQTEYKFFYEEGIFRDFPKVEVKKGRISTNTLLKQSLSNRDLNIEITKNNVILINEKSSNSLLGGQPDNEIQIIISGAITDENGTPLPGANIIEKGTTNGSQADFDGNFAITVSDENVVLVVSYIGFSTREIAVNGRNNIKVTLQESTNNLEEVVLIGYGSVKKSDLTGAVVSIKTDKIEKSTAASVGEMLSGRAPGLNVFSTSAQPGGNISFLIRGAASTVSNDPLIVVDGFPITDISEPGSGNRYSSGAKSGLSSINPDDIASVEILKDASSTAIYGARAANGVILITTKRGKKGFNINYNGSFSTQKYSDKWEMLNGSEFMNQFNNFSVENARLGQKITPYGENPESSLILPTNLYSQAEINAIGEGTNWLDHIIRTGFIQKHNLSMSGGFDKTKYMVSANIFENKGIIKSNALTKASARINLDQEIGKYFKAGISASFTREIHDNVPLGEGFNEGAGAIVAAIEVSPIVPVRDENGDFAIDPNRSFSPNPVSLLEIDDETTGDRIMAMANLQYSPIEELQFKINVGTDIYSALRTTYLPKSTLYGSQFNGKATQALNQKNDFLLDATVRYSKMFDEKHNVTLLGGYSYQEFNNNNFYATNYDFLIEQFKWYDLGGGQAAKPEVGSGGGKDLIASYFGRFQYVFNSKYLLTATMRADGASNFATNKKWGYFPSVALGWIITEESFMDNSSDIISNLKLRGGYGQTGNNAIGHRSLAGYTTGRNYAFNNLFQTGVYADQLGNPDLSWETSTEINLGLDFGILNNRLNGTFDVYQRTVSDLLAYKPLLSYHEVSSIAFNTGKTQSKGIELNLNAIVVDHEFKWDVNYNFSMYRDNWLERDPDWKPSIYETEVAPLRGIYSYISDGLVQAGEEVPHMPGILPGVIKFKDLNGFLRDASGDPVVDEDGRFQYMGKPDGKLDDADVKLLGRQEPGSMMSLNNTFEWKNFDLNIYFYGYFDRYRIDQTRDLYERRSYLIREYSNVLKTVQNAWRSDNQDSTIPGVFQGYSTYGSGDYYLQKADFIRLKNVTLGYTFPSSFIQKLGFKSSRVHFDAQNLFVLTKYTGLDPENDSRGGYPNQRTYTVGVNLSF
ncbi:SusC/RagA family TonB-linked outer membrane protein [Arenibacter algicola]